MSTFNTVVCDWCGTQLRRDGRTDLYALGWRSLSWLKSEHVCPLCREAATEGLKLVKAQRIATRRAVDINKVEDPLLWEVPEGGEDVPHGQEQEKP